MGRLTLRKGQGAIYEGLGWKRCPVCHEMGYFYRCPVCHEMGYFYRWKGLLYVKHATPIEQAAQLTFASEGLQLQQVQRQKHCTPERRPQK